MKKRKPLGTWRGALWLTLLAGLLLASGLLSGSTVGANSPFPTPTPVLSEAIPWDTLSVGSLETTVETEKPARGHPKLGSSLAQLLEAYHRGGLPEARSFATRHMLVLDDSRVQVEMVILSEALDDVRKALGVAGGEYQGHYKTLVQALLPINTLESLAQRSDVQFVREPRRAIPLAISEGVGASNATSWHAAGYNGSGVKVAIIDAGFDGYTSLLGTDLPASVTARDYTDTGMGGTKHGTACAEVVYDMAPGIQMYLSKVSTVVELSNAVNDLIADGVDIISMSLGWTIDGPGDGTGTLASIVNNARSNGIFFAMAAGNNAQVSWSGQYVNHPSVSGTHQWPHGGNVNCFGPGTDFSCYTIPAGTQIKVGLHWDDWTAVTQDYDLYLLKWTGSSWVTVTGSSNWQNEGAGQTPTEYISYTTAGSSTAYAVKVVKYSATRDVCFRVVAPNMGHLDEWVEQRSLTFPADSPYAITVGAVDVNPPYSLESYSSRGPTFGPGGACSGGSTKPDIAAYANVSTVSYGPGGFNGTSAATPHEAGAASLVKQRYPGYSVSQLQSYFESNAIDLGDPDKDNLYGSGRLHLGDPSDACTYSISPTSQSFPPEGGTGSVSVTASNGCNWTAASNVTWITIASGNSGSGNGTVSYSVATNTSTSSRTGTLTIAGQSFTITQAGADTTEQFTISGTVRDYDGTPLQNVLVRTDSGPFYDSDSTGADGTYTLTVITGTYRIEVSKSDYPAPLPQTVTVPPSRADVDFTFLERPAARLAGEGWTRAVCISPDGTAARFQGKLYSRTEEVTGRNVRVWADGFGGRPATVTPDFISQTPYGQHFDVTVTVDATPDFVPGTYQGTLYAQGDNTYLFQLPLMFTLGFPCAGGHLALDGDDDYAEAENHPELDVGDEAGESLTVEGWFSVIDPNPFPTRVEVIACKWGSYCLYIQRGAGEPDLLTFRLWQTSSSYREFTRFLYYMTTGWHHIAGVFDNTTDEARLYYDGALQLTEPFTETLNSSVDPVRIGGLPTENHFDGNIEEVRISDTPRYSGSSYAAPNSPFACDANTRALWHFDDGDGATQFHDACGMDNLLIGYNGAHSEGAGLIACYDFDGGGVGVSDVQIIASRWRCKCGDTCYNPLYDLDQDCDIDIKDIMRPTPLLGETCQSGGPAGINGLVTLDSAPAAGLSLDLRFWNGTDWSTQATAITGSDGRYNFTGAPSLGAGQVYYVRYGPNGTNTDHLSAWYGPDIPSYTAGESVPGGDFDIANVSLASPDPTSALPLPITFTWQQRGVTTDTYRWVLFDPVTHDGWITDDLGYADSFTLTSLPEGVEYGKEYGWHVRVYNGSDSFGTSFYYRTITLLSGGVLSRVVSLTSLPAGEGRDLAERAGPVRIEEK